MVLTARSPASATASAADLPRTLPFWKMHGAGNDFVVAESEAADAPWGELARRICDRHFGVGADGLLLVLPSTVADRRMRIFNADGSEAEMCGNGVRCFVKYALDRGLVAAPAGMPAGAQVATMTIETAAGVLRAEATRGPGGDDAAATVATVRVTMGRPDLRPQTAGARIATPPPVLDLPIEAAGETRAITIVSLGNPHAVSFLDGPPAEYPVQVVGPAIERHELFANRTNAEFVRVIDRTHIEMRVWERGVGETLACGSGACAAVVAAQLHGLVDHEVRVALPGGTLSIEWDGDGEVLLIGPVARVFDSVWHDPGADGEGAVAQ